MAITFGSLFAGIGGFDLGFERAGMVCKWQVELDDYATRVLEKHWPGVHRERDVTQCGKHNLERVDVICGGFPCQDISYAGRGAGLDGERSGLFFETVRVVCELRPRIVVLENVAALLNRGLDRVLGTLAAVGFDAEWHCIPAAAVGAPHIRDRVFVIGRNDTDANRNGREARGGIKGSKTQTRQTHGCNSERLCRPMADTDQRRHGASQSEIQSRRNSLKHGDWWKTEPNVGRVADGFPARVDRLKGLGNAVVPQVAEYVGRQIVEAF